MNDSLKLPIYKLIYILNKKNKISSHLDISYYNKIPLNSKITYTFSNMSGSRRYHTYIKRYYSPKIVYSSLKNGLMNYKLNCQVHPKTISFCPDKLSLIPNKIKIKMFDQSNKICKLTGNTLNVVRYKEYANIIEPPHNFVLGKFTFQKINNNININEKDNDYLLEILKLKSMKNVNFNSPSDPLILTVNPFLEQFLFNLINKNSFSFNLFMGLTSNYLPTYFDSNKIHLENYQKNQEISLLVRDDYNSESFVPVNKGDVNYFLDRFIFFQEHKLLNLLDFTDKHDFSLNKKIHLPAFIKQFTESLNSNQFEIVDHPRHVDSNSLFFKLIDSLNNESKISYEHSNICDTMPNYDNTIKIDLSKFYKSIERKKSTKLKLVDETNKYEESSTTELLDGYKVESKGGSKGESFGFGGEGDS